MEKKLICALGQHLRQALLSIWPLSKEGICESFYPLLWCLFPTNSEVELSTSQQIVCIFQCLCEP